MEIRNAIAIKLQILSGKMEFRWPITKRKWIFLSLNERKNVDCNLTVNGASQTTSAKNDSQTWYIPETKWEIILQHFYTINFHTLGTRMYIVYYILIINYYSQKNNIYGIK